MSSVHDAVLAVADGGFAWADNPQDAAEIIAGLEALGECPVAIPIPAARGLHPRIPSTHRLIVRADIAGAARQALQEAFSE